MTDIFISYAHEDQAFVRRLVSALEAEGLSVWWDHTIPPGQSWDSFIARGIEEARCCIVLWSKHSVASDWVKEEATLAKEADKLLPAQIDDCLPPIGFRRIQAAQLKGWNGRADDAQWTMLVREARSIVTRTSGGTVASGPNAHPPYVPSPAAKKMPWAIVGGLALVIAFVGGGGYYFWAHSQSANAAASAWQSVDQNNAYALREFIAGNPDDYLEDAQQALAELEERVYEAASDADTIEALESFLSDFPESNHALAARGRIAELRSGQPQASLSGAAESQTRSAPAQRVERQQLDPPAVLPEAAFWIVGRWSPSGCASWGEGEQEFRREGNQIFNYYNHRPGTPFQRNTWWITSYDDRGWQTNHGYVSFRRSGSALIARNGDFDCTWTRLG